MRSLVFAGLVAVLVAALVWVAFDREPPSAATDHRGFLSTIAEASAEEHPAPPSAARASARRFLHAFLAYEVGADDPASTRLMRVTAAPAFARELLAPPPPPVGADPGPARLASLRVDPIAGHPDLALVSGTARRRSGPEPFAFVFVHRGHRWLAVAPGE